MFYNLECDTPRNELKDIDLREIGIDTKSDESFESAGRLGQLEVAVETRAVEDRNISNTG